MKIINITGGLGNQMFQYAFALAMQKKYPEEDIYIDIQHYKSLFFSKFKGINLHNGFEIKTIFKNANLPIAGYKQLIKLSYWIPNYILSRIGRKILPKRKREYVAPYILNYCYDKKAYESNGDGYLEGYWQCIKYYTPIKSDLYELYAHPKPNLYNSNLIDQIRNCNSIGIHVRRGDYLDEPEFKGICDIDYYRHAIDRVLEKSIKNNNHFFIFSNDIDWCKHNLVPLMKGNKVHFVTENKGEDSCWDMFLMTYCKKLIIANSSFSWWGAFLNKNVELVIAPYPWLNRKCDIDIYDSSWELIKS